KTGSTARKSEGDATGSFAAGRTSHLRRLLPHVSARGFGEGRPHVPGRRPRSASDGLRPARYFFFFAAFFLARFLAMMNSFGWFMDDQGRGPEVTARCTKCATARRR